MRKLLFIILFFLLVRQITFGQFHNLNNYIPAGFAILDSASGDINGDGIKDLIIILKNKYENINSDTTRPLLLLQGNSKRQYKLLARNDYVVLCEGCGGIFGDPYQGITIKRGYFSIVHYGGSNWRWTRIITFKYNLNSKHFILHRDSLQSYHVSDLNKTTETLFYKENFDKLLFEKYSNRNVW